MSTALTVKKFFQVFFAFFYVSGTSVAVVDSVPGGCLPEQENLMPLKALTMRMHIFSDPWGRRRRRKVIFLR